MKMPTPGERAATLDAMRGRKMARSAHAHVRGNTATFYEWLADSRAAKRVPMGPAVWICGDCHLSNLGPVSDGKGRIEVQIRDFDQAVIGNAAHDLVRLGLSLATAARGSDLPGVATARIIEAMIEGYAAALGDPTAGTPGPSRTRCAASGGARGGGAGATSPGSGLMGRSRRSRSVRCSGRWTSVNASPSKP